MDINFLLNSYTTWLRTQFQTRSLPDNKKDAYEITTPFLNNINDSIRLYVEDLGKGKIRLSDDGNTLNDLLLSGIDISSSETRLKLISDIKQNYQINQSDDVLFTVGPMESFPEMKQRLISAVIRIDDITFTKRSNVEQLFFDEVYNYFDKNDFGGIPQHPIEGRSGISYTLHYVIPARKKNQEKLFSFQNQISYNQMGISAYMYQDIKNSVGSHEKTADSKLVIIYNDAVRNPSSNVFKIAADAEIQLIPWSAKKSLLQQKND